jgi:hypothetical protein
MAVLLVTYDLKQPGRDYAPVHAYLKRFTHCKGLESVWLLDTVDSPESIRDGLRVLVDTNDIVFVSKLTRYWGSWNYSCAGWLNDSSRNW